MKNQKIKLIIFHPYSLVGGADLSISTLINNLDNKKYSIDFICVKRAKNTNKLKKSIKIYSLNKSKTIYSILELRKIIKKNLNKYYKKVILFSNQNFANIISYFATINIDQKLKKIAIERNHISEFSYYSNIKEFLYKNMIKNLTKLTYNSFDEIVCNSNESAKDLTKFLNRKVISIQNPIMINFKNKIKKNNKFF